MLRKHMDPCCQSVHEAYVLHCYRLMQCQNERLAVALHRSQLEVGRCRQLLSMERKKQAPPATVSCNKRRCDTMHSLTKKKQCSPNQQPDGVAVIVLDPSYVALAADQLEPVLSSVFRELRTLEDIIKMSTHPHRRCLQANDKFARLVKITEPVKALQALVGLEAIKAKAFDIIAHYALNRTPSSSDLMHMVIEGPPGVGKTEVGRLLGRVILALGVLKKDTFICARRSDMVGEYLGQTAPRTQAVVDSAIGGVLFIDEAYSLGHPEKRDSFSKECIDTLNQNLTEKKGQFLCIVAGYEEELESCFFAVNKGLRRRFPVRLAIKPYSFSELHKIFMGKVQQAQWTLESSDRVLDLFKAKYKYFHFSAGDTETLLAQSKFVAAGRLLRASSTFADSPALILEDLEEAYVQSFKMREGTTGTLSMYS